MCALELLESGMEPWCPTFRAELETLSGIARAGDVEPGAMRADSCWGDLRAARGMASGTPAMPEARVGAALRGAAVS